uniref:Uncharacterized protein n=1 Tax=Palpitomonas bilix TaxID=652834 RepID=A0A7S3DHJ7_9EUKA
MCYECITHSSRARSGMMHIMSVIFSFALSSVKPTREQTKRRSLAAFALPPAAILCSYVTPLFSSAFSSFSLCSFHFFVAAFHLPSLPHLSPSSLLMMLLRQEGEKKQRANHWRFKETGSRIR